MMQSSRASHRDVIVAASCGLVVALMVGASYAAVPLYDWFCRATGFNGTTQIATSAPVETLGRRIAVRFDANVGPGLAWKFEPEKTEIDVAIGEVVTAYYTVVNQTARTTTGLAAYNVTPLNTGVHFQKINCFCFTDQTLKAGEKREMAVVFYVDPALAADPEFDDLKTITLSYTFYAERAPDPKSLPKPQAANDAVKNPDKSAKNL